MKQFPSKIFIDGGDVAETGQAVEFLGRIDGQTTNPSLIASNPQIKEKLSKGKKFTEDEAMDAYKQIVREFTELVDWSVSVETYADKDTKAEEMLIQAREMFSWSEKVWVKMPVTHEGLKAAEQAVKEGIRLNMTLCFSQAQAAAVYSATKGAKKGNVFVSPFVGRLDDRGENGMKLIDNMIKMYEAGDGHVSILTASVRNLDHLLYALKIKSPIITIPFKVFQNWREIDFLVPSLDWQYDPAGLKKIPYRKISLDKSWEKYDIRHDLTDSGLARFASDWKGMIQNL